MGIAVLGNREDASCRPHPLTRLKALMCFAEASSSRYMSSSRLYTRQIYLFTNALFRRKKGIAPTEGM